MNRRPVMAERILESDVESALGLFVQQLVDGLVAAAPGRLLSVHLACFRPLVHRKAE